LQEAEEAFSALQVLDGNEDNGNVGTNSDEVDSGDDNSEFLHSLEDIEPQPYFSVSSIVDDNDNDYDYDYDYDSLALLSSDILDLLSNVDFDTDGVRDSIALDENENDNKVNVKPTGDKDTNRLEENESDNPTDFTPNTTITNTTLAEDSLPEIEIDFVGDPFLINSDQLCSVFDGLDEDTNNRDGISNIKNEDGEENDVKIISQDEGTGKHENAESIFDELVGQQQTISASQSDHYQPQQDQTDKEGELLQHPIVEEFPLDIDLETEELYKELSNMSLTGNHANANGIRGDYNNETETADESAENSVSKDRNITTMDLLMGPHFNLDDGAGTDGLPYYLVCQPCTPGDYDTIASSSNNPIFGGGDPIRSLDYSLPPITEDRPMDAAAESEAVQREREQHIRDLRALYMASAAVNQDDLPRLDHSDPLLKELEAQYDDSEQLAQQLQYQLYQQQQEEEYEKVWENAKHWSTAFGVNLDEANDNINGERKISPSKDTSKPGLGHKETIFGVTFSEDGKYVATACQDSTIGIWEVATSRLLSSLKGHDIKHECLRVAWANRMWADDILDRSALFANLVASSGADGTVKLWACRDKKGGLDKEGRRSVDNEWKCEYTLDHTNLLSLGSEQKDKTDRNEGKSGEDEDETSTNDARKEDKPQVYCLQFIDHWNIFTKHLSEQNRCARHSQQEEQPQHESEDDDNCEKNSFLMTSSDEFIHLWEVKRHAVDKQLKLNDQKIRILQDKMKLREVMSLHFGPLDQYSYGVTACSISGAGMQLPPPPTKHKEEKDKDTAFGGDRNPDNKIFVFDAAYCPGSGLLGVALADGSLRLVNARGSCISVIQLPGNSSHLTSFCWDKSGTRLATCAATGHLITWSLDAESHQGGNYNTVATCTAIFEGGHQNGRPLFGSRYCGGEDENLLLSWGVDGKICLWYSQSHGNIYDPIAILKDDGDYPIYAAEVSPSERNVVVGGGSEGGFIGVPVHFYGIPPLVDTNEKVVGGQTSQIKE
jgi:WD40 repeat protein